MAKNTNQSIRQLTKLATSSASKEEKQVEKRLKKEFQEWLKRFQTFSKQMVFILNLREKKKEREFQNTESVVLVGLSEL